MNLLMRRFCGEHFAAKLERRHSVGARLYLRTQNLPVSSNGGVVSDTSFKRERLYQRKRRVVQSRSDSLRGLILRASHRLRQSRRLFDIENQPSSKSSEPRFGSSIELSALFNHLAIRFINLKLIGLSVLLKLTAHWMLNAQAPNEVDLLTNRRLELITDPDRGPPNSDLMTIQRNQAISRWSMMSVVVVIYSFLSKKWCRMVARWATIRCHFLRDAPLSAEVLYV